MKQRNFSFRSVDEAVAAALAIADYVHSTAHADALLMMLVKWTEEDDARRLLDAFDKHLPDVKRAGISEYPLGVTLEERDDFPRVRLNVLLSESAHFTAVQLPCNPGGENAAAERLAQVLEGTDDVKGVALFPANLSLDVTSFLRSASAECGDVPFFGVMAFPSESVILPQPHGGSFCLGDELLGSGFTTVIFSGADLHVFMDYVLGWRAVGGEMELAPGVPSELGEGCISVIDGAPALQVYDRYLGVGWDENFVTNVCEFPLMVNRNGVDLCMIPFAAGEAGELYLSTPVYTGEKLRFSYGTRESVLGATRAGCERMADFGAQAVFMTLCGNRRLFLGDDAHLEWDMYRETNPDLTYCHGEFEIAWRGDVLGEGARGGVLNSAIVAVGFREGPGEKGALEELHSKCMLDGTCDVAPQEGGPIPLSYRVSRFFDVMTGELVHLQHNLEEEVERKTRENEGLMLHVVITLAAAIDAKDSYTNGHSGRVAKYSREIARRAGYSEQRQQEIYVMGVLHDVGKIGVPDAIINKPGRLTDEEFEVIKTHPATGARILSAIEEMPGLAVGAHWHHERYDGRGYPDGLAGEDIPEEARIIAVADAYDAMTSNRSYRDAMPQEKVREQVERGRGTQFDPRFADIMLAMIDDDPGYRMRELS